MFISLICVVTLLSLGCFTLVLIFSVVGAPRSTGSGETQILCIYLQCGCAATSVSATARNRMGTDVQPNDVVWTKQNYEDWRNIFVEHIKNPFIICSRSKLKSSSRDANNGGGAGRRRVQFKCHTNNYELAARANNLFKCRKMKNSTQSNQRNSYTGAENLFYY